LTPVNRQAAASPTLAPEFIWKQGSKLNMKSTLLALAGILLASAFFIADVAASFPVDAPKPAAQAAP
jgi:hypothetical protein